MRVFAEADPGLFISVGRHTSGRFGDISAHDHETSEVWLLDPLNHHSSCPNGWQLSNLASVLQKGRETGNIHAGLDSSGESQFNR